MNGNRSTLFPMGALRVVWRLTALAVVAASLFAGGCGEVDAFPEPGAATESASIVRQLSAGPIVATFTSYPLRKDSPPDGVRLAMLRAVGGNQCSAASFFWSDRALALRWLDEQIAARRRAGWPVRVVLAGHGLGATEASEVAKELITRGPDVEIAMLVTVDAVKPGRIGTAAGAAGNVIANRLPGVNTSFTAYDAAPAPDGMRLWAHVNYYQNNSGAYHGAPMPWAENHLLSDWTGVLNHGNADDFAMPLVQADLTAAIQRSMR